MHRGNARCFEAVLEIQVEVRCIDPDEQSRTLFEQPGKEIAPDSHDFAIMPQHLDIASHRQLLHRVETVEAVAHHPRTADPVERQARTPLGQRADQMAAEQIAGGLSRHHGNACGAHLRTNPCIHSSAPYRTIPRVEPPRKSRSRATSVHVAA